jgi:hypothetical protein
MRAVKHSRTSDRQFVVDKIAVLNDGLAAATATIGQDFEILGAQTHDHELMAKYLVERHDLERGLPRAAMEHALAVHGGTVPAESPLPDGCNSAHYTIASGLVKGRAMVESHDAALLSIDPKEMPHWKAGFLTAEAWEAQQRVQAAVKAAFENCLEPAHEIRTHILMASLRRSGMKATDCFLAVDSMSEVARTFPGRAGQLDVPQIDERVVKDEYREAYDWAKRIVESALSLRRELRADGEVPPSWCKSSYILLATAVNQLDFESRRQQMLISAEASRTVRSARGLQQRDPAHVDHVGAALVAGKV